MMQEVADQREVDIVREESRAHLVKRVENCVNYDQDARGKHYHPLKLIREVDRSKAIATIDPKIAQVTIREVCETCGQQYSQKVIPLSRGDLLEREGITV